MRFWFAAVAVCAALNAHAQETPAGTALDEALQWLKRIAESSRTVSYSGTFVYQHGNRVESSRVVHYVNSAGGVFERLETLDGPAREIVRANDNVTAYLPDQKVVLVERRNTRHLPVMLPEKLSDLTVQYDVRKLEKGRVTGYECVWLEVIPKDKLRYGRKFCAESASGLPLRAQVFNERSHVVESFAFSQVTLGGKFNREEVASRYEAIAQRQNWRVDRSALNIMEQAADTGWTVTNLPSGFRKTMEVRRSIVGRPAILPHLVYSDGLAAISVFIEPKTRDLSGRTLMNQGAVHIYKRVLGEHIVTVLGEAPVATIMQIADSIAQRGSNGALPGNSVR